MRTLCISKKDGTVYAEFDSESNALEAKSKIDDLLGVENA
jgi:hypothetical protein